MSSPLTLVSLATIYNAVGANAFWPFSEPTESTVSTVVNSMDTKYFAAAFFTGLAIGGGLVATYQRFYTKKVEVKTPTIDAQNDATKSGGALVLDALRAVADEMIVRPSGSFEDQAASLELRAKTLTDQAGALNLQAAALRAQKRDLPSILDCAKVGNTTDLAHLITNNADLGAVDEDKKNALHLAAANGHPKFVNKLLNYLKSQADDAKSIDIDAKDGKGDTALHHAVRSKKDDSIKDLLKAGAKFDVAGENGKTAQESAVELGLKIDFSKYTETKKMQKTRSEKAEPKAAEIKDLKAIFDCAKTGDVDGLKALIKANADLTLVDSNGSNAFHLAAAAGHAKFIEKLAQSIKGQTEGPRVIDALDAKGDTALHIALDAKSQDAAKKLLEADARFDIARKDGKTAQQLAEELQSSVTFPKPKAVKQPIEIGFGPVKFSVHKKSSTKEGDGALAATDSANSDESSGENEKK